MHRFLFGILSVALSLFAAAGPACAQTYPDRPIRWIIPWPPGGGADVIARLMGNQVAEGLGKPVIIENRAGAAGNIGAQQAARATPDGYTIVFAYSGTHSINRHLYKEMTFEESDFVPVIFLADVPQMLVVNAALPVNNLNQLVQLARKKPGSLTYASYGPGSQPQLATEMIKQKTQTFIVHVPYRGIPQAVMAVVAWRGFHVLQKEIGPRVPTR